MHTYPDSIEEKLGFTLVRRRLRQLLKGPLGKERLDGMRPARSREWLEAELERVHEYQEALRYDRGVPLQHVHDVRGTLRKARPEDAYVSAEALHAVRQILVTGQRLARYFADRQADYPTLARSTRRIDPPNREAGLWILDNRYDLRMGEGLCTESLIWLQQVLLQRPKV